MIWIPALLFLMTQISYGDFQPVLVQEPSVMVQAGQNAEIPCTLSTGKNFDIYRVIWLRETPGGAIEMVYHFRTGSTQGQGPGIPERFSVKDDVPNRRWYLVVNGVQTEDDTVYHCATYFDETYWYHSGVNIISTGDINIFLFFELQVTVERTSDFPPS
ncbi:PREDICTED: immunoglobulin omega chain-like [Nanorana parkeri]|uniref:immunoglobulin omega chain-like n=1 Tax=Nanorana parkeri TaxID=125878 RepID=UPI000854A661|nr:PREDICTED: immunoglobulin omega chain-like [Nanorana parkeri]